MKHIKIMRSYRCREFYGKYMKDGQALGTFVKFFQENGIADQYTMFGSSN